MSLQSLIYAALLALLAGCTRTEANQTTSGRAESSLAASKSAPEVGGMMLPAEPRSPAAAAGRIHSSTRSFARDYDADGIDDYRVVITETFDDAGNLLSRTKDQDFDADGIVDSHVTTTFETAH